MKELNVSVYREELVIYLRTVGVASVLAHCTVIHSAYVGNQKFTTLLIE